MKNRDGVESHVGFLPDLKRTMDQLESELGSNAREHALEFISESTSQGRKVHYKEFPERAHALFLSYDRGADPAAGAAARFLRFCILVAVEKTARLRQSNPLPALLQKEQFRHLGRIASERNLSTEWLRMDADLFHKEFGIASERLFAAGSQLVDPNCGLPRSLPFREGVWRSAGKILPFLRTGGVSPWFQIHTHTFNLDRFDEDGWDDCYRGCAELYRVFPDTRGMFGSSWFYDPLVPDISPRLGYLRKKPLDGGAFIHFYSAGEDAIASATATSPTRRALFEAGKYLPKNYMLVWPRAAQIAWVASAL